MSFESRLLILTAAMGLSRVHSEWAHTNIIELLLLNFIPGFVEILISFMVEEII